MTSEGRAFVRFMLILFAVVALICGVLYVALRPVYRSEQRNRLRQAQECVDRGGHPVNTGGRSYRFACIVSGDSR